MCRAQNTSPGCTIADLPQCPHLLGVAPMCNCASSFSSLAYIGKHGLLDLELAVASGERLLVVFPRPLRTCAFLRRTTAGPATPLSNAHVRWDGTANGTKSSVKVASPVLGSTGMERSASAMPIGRRTRRQERMHRTPSR